MADVENRLLRINEVVQRVGIARSTIWLWVKTGKFPKGKKLSSKVTVWQSQEIDSFIVGKWSESQEKFEE